jgi:hypothetical protein
MVMPIDHGKSFTPWDEGYSGKPDPLLSTAMGNLAFDAIKDAKQKKAFVRALKREAKNFDSAKFDKALGQMADKQAYLSDERHFLDDISEFVTGRKAAIDGDIVRYADSLPGGDITTGFDISPAAQKQLTPEFAGGQIQKKSKLEVPLHYMAYDGGEIKDGRVRARKVRVQQYNDDGTKGKAKANGTEVTFKLRNKALFDLVDTGIKGEDGWEYEAGMSIPNPAKTVHAKTSGYSSVSDAKVFDPNGITMRKKLDDGTTIFVYTRYKGQSEDKAHSQNSFSGFVRVVSPEKSDVVLTSDNLEQWTSAVGVKSHGVPSPDDIEDMARQKLAVSFLGRQQFETFADTDAALEYVEGTFGVSVDDLEVGFDLKGQMQIRLQEGALEEIPILKDAGFLTHNKWHSTKGTEATADKGAKWILDGMLPTTDRWMTELNTTGGSSHADAEHHGSAEFMYTYLHKGDVSKKQYEDMLAGKNANTTGAQLSMVYGTDHLRNIGFRVTTNDQYGDPNYSSSGPIDHGISSIQKGTTGNIQFLPKGTIAPTRHDRLYVSGSQVRAGILTRLEAAGVLDIDGVPIDQFVILK